MAALAPSTDRETAHHLGVSLLSHGKPCSWLTSRYKILFLDVLFPQDLDKVIFVDADQIVRTDMKELIDVDLQGRVYGYAPMGNSREEMEGFRFWKTGYWKEALRGRPYHISALYVVDLKRFRQLATGVGLLETPVRNP